MSTPGKIHAMGRERAWGIETLCKTYVAESRGPRGWGTVLTTSVLSEVTCLRCRKKMPVKPETNAEPDPILEIGDRVLLAALEQLRVVSPQGWANMYAVALRAGYHSTDLGIIHDARLISMRRGGRKFGVQS